MLRYFRISALAVLLILSSAALYAQEQKPGGAGAAAGPPPARVVVSEVSRGMMAPEAEFIGTVYYQEVSEVASEVSGRVEAVNFEEGVRVKEGFVLARVDAQILKKVIESTRASYEQVLSDLEKARIDLRRFEGLFEKELISEKDHDEAVFTVRGLEKRADSLKAELGRYEVELGKKDLPSPFGGVVLKKHVDRGEWLSPGSVVATVARDDYVDIVVNVPGEVLMHTREGMSVEMRAGGRMITGSVFAIVPSGDVPTRTFPVKIRVRNTYSLIGGMEALVRLPVGAKVESLLVNRDAVIPVFGQNAVFAVVEGSAVMIPVQIVGFEGMKAGVSAMGLEPGMKVVIKGQERLSQGQTVEVLEERK